jgi:hypothetical protein
LRTNTNPLRLRNSPQLNNRYSAIAKFAFAHIPLVALIHRFMIAATVCHA